MNAAGARGVAPQGFALRCIGCLAVPSLLVALLCATARGAPQPYDFLIDPAGSPADVALDISAKTSGTLVGDYDPLANAAGTRTKPGVFGTFGATENVP